MPKISLVVCLKSEGELLARLLEKSAGCFDDLVVVHDGPENFPTPQSPSGNAITKEIDWKSPEHVSLSKPAAPPKILARDFYHISPHAPLPSGYRLVEGDPNAGSIHELVNHYGGRFFEGPRCFQQEPHWPFAWWAAKNDWILRLDADEYPSASLQKWLLNFIAQDSQESGFMAIWPLWTGKKEIWSSSKPTRLFLFNRHLVKFIGMVERSPEFKDRSFHSLNLHIHHRPKRKSYGVVNLLGRRQAYRWRKVISQSLLLEPFDLPRWNYSENKWDAFWQEIRDRPLKTAIFRGFSFASSQARMQAKAGSELAPDAILGTGIHHLMMAFSFWLNKILFKCNGLKPHGK